MKVIDYFEKAYVVNLPERKDRLRDMKRELEKADMPLDSKKVHLFPAFKPDIADPFNSIGVKGCFLSHYTILKEARDKNLRNVLIMEDDLAISSDFSQYAEMILTQLTQNNWSFVYFGHQLQKQETIKGAAGQKLHRYDDPIRTTHFYGVNGTVLNALVTFLELVQQRPAGHPDGGPMHVDGAFSTFRQQNPHLLTLVAIPNLGWQRSSRSDLSPRWFDTIPGINTIINQARKLNSQSISLRNISR